MGSTLKILRSGFVYLKSFSVLNKGSYSYIFDYYYLEYIFYFVDLLPRETRNDKPSYFPIYLIIGLLCLL